uniref:Uncharacterized protein n=1 Tax=Eutreptiella gymnastica TaxID=73025 RepID=A0A6U7UAX6_9EUGL|mmetsp:Transcript_122576/g.212546  ORF Transcript_122576/g.212546 Transcript_122576/m.212546 type:complete len:110 (+) Transcript_122576:480-809(+)
MAMGRLLADFIQATAAALPAQSRSAVQAILHGEKTGLTLKDMGGAYYCVCGNLAPSARSEWGCPATTGHLGHINVVRPRLVDTGGGGGFSFFGGWGGGGYRFPVVPENR